MNNYVRHQENKERACMGRTHARKEVQVHARKPPSAALLHFTGDFLHVDLKNVRRLSLYKDCPWFIAIAQGPLIGP